MAHRSALSPAERGGRGPLFCWDARTSLKGEREGVREVPSCDDEAACQAGEPLTTIVRAGLNISLVTSSPRLCGAGVGTPAFDPSRQ